MLRKTLIATACTAGLLAAPVAAQASTVSFDGTTVKVVGTDGKDSHDASVYEGVLKVAGSPVYAGPGCTGDDNHVQVECPAPSGGIKFELGAGDDVVHNSLYDQPAGYATVDLGPGNDRLETYGGDTAFGGDGNDELEALNKSAVNVFEGGAGNDKLSTAGGADVLRGGDGDDVLDGDPLESRSPDVIDGGNGRDTVDDWMSNDPYDKTPATVTLDGVADDGFPGEGDNVTNVESIRSANGIVFKGTDAPEQVIASEVGGKGSQEGRGGDDSLQGSDDDESFDGGAGNDDIRAGFGNDTITGGAGQDKIVADRDGRCNEMHCDLSPGSAADTIDAVDGERDTIACGPGNDTVKADAADDVAPDCENVTRAGGTPNPRNEQGDGGVVGTPAGSTVGLAVKGAKSLKALKAGKLVIRVSGLQPGGAVKLTGKVRGKVVASGSGRADTRGAAGVKLKLSKAGKKALKRSRSASLVVGGAGRTITLKLR